MCAAWSRRAPEHPREIFESGLTSGWLPHRCGGDSGGPYFNKVDGKLQLVGLVNRGPSCPSSWDVAASVGAPEIRAWIEEGMESIWTGCPGGAWIASNANTAGEVYVCRARIFL